MRGFKEIISVHKVLLFFASGAEESDGVVAAAPRFSFGPEQVGALLPEHRIKHDENPMNSHDP